MHLTAFLLNILQRKNVHRLIHAAASSSTQKQNIGESESLHLESNIVNAYESLWFFSRELCLQTVYGAGAPEDELYEKFSLRWRGVPGEV